MIFIAGYSELSILNAEEEESVGRSLASLCCSRFTSLCAWATIIDRHLKLIGKQMHERIATL